MEESDPTHALARALADVAGAPVELERPADARHGDYATNVALQLAGDERQPPREVAEELAGGSPRSTASRPSTSPGPGFLNLTVDDALARGRRSRAVLAAGGRFGGGSADAPERDPGGARLGEPDRADHRRLGPERRLRRRGRAAARVRRQRRSSASTTTTTPARRWTSSAPRSTRSGAGRSRPRTATAASTSPTSPRSDGDPVPRMLEQIEAALERFRIHFDSFERQSVVEAEIPEAIALLETYEDDGAVWARTSAPRRRQGPRRRPLGRHADLLRRRRRLHPPQVRAWLRPARVRARRRPPRLRCAAAGARRDARPPARVAGGADLPARPPDPQRARRRRCRSAAATSSSSTTSSTRSAIDAARWYLLSRGHDQTIEIDVDLAAERSQKNPVYYVQYAHARIAGILRNAEGRRRPTRGRSCRWRRRGARSRQAPARASRGGPRGDGAARARTRSRPTRSGSPTTSTASTTTTACSTRTRRPSGSRSAPRRRSVVATCLDLLGVEAPDRM